MIVFCASCWAENVDTAVRCSSCGADLTGGLDQKSYVEKLLRALQSHPILETRVRAAWILGKRREVQAVPILMEVLATAGDSELKEAAVVSLGEIGDRRAIPLLLVLAKTGPLAVRVKAVEILGEMGDASITEQLSTLAREDSTEIVREAERSLKKIQAGASGAPAKPDNSANP